MTEQQCQPIQTQIKNESEETIMKLHAKMTPQEWKDLLNYLMREGVLITYIPTTDDDGLFVDFKYAIV
jgi:hypothetical protein